MSGFLKLRERWRYLCSGQFADDYLWFLRRRLDRQELTETYHRYHDLACADLWAAQRTEAAFSRQWETYPSGNFLLSDPGFRERITEIICHQEICLQPDWFEGKTVLDAGCGNGRWSYALAKLGARVTAVDASEVALSQARDAIAEYGDGVSVSFVQSPLEKIAERLSSEKFDLVFCWGVLHHCRSFDDAFNSVSECVKDGGLVYLYLYGRETLPLERDLRMFEERLLYNSLKTDEERCEFLLRKAGGDAQKLHNVHDIYAPLINRRFQFEDIHRRLQEFGFTDVSRTIDHTELFIRAIRGSPNSELVASFLPNPKPPYWFQGG